MYSSIQTSCNIGHGTQTDGVVRNDGAQAVFDLKLPRNDGAQAAFEFSRHNYYYGVVSDHRVLFHKKYRKILEMLFKLMKLCEITIIILLPLNGGQAAFEFSRHNYLSPWLPVGRYVKLQ